MTQPQAQIGTGSLRDVMRVALPLMISSASIAVKLFCDRLMLTHHSEVAIRAAMPAGITLFTIMVLFLGTAGYAQTFVAQYTGAGKPEQSGPAAWQGIMVALFGGLIVAATALVSEPFFTFVGHGPEVAAAEAQYYNIQAIGAVFPLLVGALGAFWGGRGRTGVLMLVTMFTACCNVAVNFVLIEGRFGAPSLGISGAAIGTVVSEAIGVLILGGLFLRRPNREQFNTWPERRFDWELFRRLLRFGLPNGLRACFELGAFNMFVLLVGRYGDNIQPGEANPQEAANIAFSINGIAFIPLMGLGQAVAIMVGQAIGAQQIPVARRVVRSSILLGTVYMGTMAAAFVLAPHWILGFFVRPDDPGQAATLAMGVIVLRFIAAWELLDACWVVIFSALQGAGDTRFTLWMNLALAWGGFVVPLLIAVWLGSSVWVLWWLLLAWVVLGTILFSARYLHGAWTRMSVIA